MAIDTPSLDDALPIAGAPGPPPPAEDPARGDANWRRLALLLVAAALALVGIGGLVRIATRGSGHPDHWDARLGDLPQTVARLRGLSFDHPVPVRYLSDKEFRGDQGLGLDQPTKKQRAQIERATAFLRALGLVTGKVDLFDAVKTSQGSRVLAYYSPTSKEIVVRGGGKTLDVPHRVVLAHELTHVLQDQHFDLDALQERVRKAPGQSSDALRAFVEGDATRIEDRYRSELSAADRAEYARWEKRTNTQADAATAKVPAIIEVTEGAPYVFGPSALRVVTADGGNAAVDRVFEHGVFTQKLFIEPITSFDEAAPKPIAAPKPVAGEKRVGKPEELGAFDLYLLLASRSEPVPALQAATRWSGGRMTTVRDHGQICVRAAIRGTTAAGTDRIGQRLQAWALGLPAGMAEVDRRGATVSVHSCDPDAATAVSSPDAALDAATTVLAVHNEIEAGIVKDTRDAGLPVRTASCIAMELIASPQLEPLLLLPDDQVTQEQVQGAFRDAAPAVRRACGL